MSEQRIDPRALLAGIRTIAVVGLSPDRARPSNEVFRFLVARGYDCIGVNPGIAGRTIHGAPVVARLADVGKPIDMVDIFRTSDAAGGIVDDALALDPLPRVIWMQRGVIDHAAETRAEAAGIAVVMNNCPKLVLGG